MSLNPANLPPLNSPALPANSAAPASMGAASANNVSLAADSAAFSTTGSFTLPDLANSVAELDKRIAALEAQLSGLVSPGEPLPAPAPAPTAGELPPIPLPGQTVVSATNGAAAPAANTATARGEYDRVVSFLQGLKDTVTQRLAELDRLLGAQPTPASAAERSALDRQMAGLQAVSHVLRNAKLTGLSAEEEPVATAALGRVHQIAAAIGNGEDPNGYAAELFTLKHTLADPALNEPRAHVTGAAQVVALVNGPKADLNRRLQALEAEAARGPLPQDKAAEKAQLESQFKAFIGIEKALETAKLTRLSPEGDQRAAEAIARLGDMAEQLTAGTADPAQVEQEAFRLGQTLRNPNNPGEPAQVAHGASVLQQIQDVQGQVSGRLRDIDAKIMGGAAPEQYAAERAKLMERGEALGELADVVKDARLDQTNPAAKREVAAGLERAAKVALALGEGESPSKFRAEVFGLKQTFQEPLASKNNAAVQSGAAAMQMLGRAEAKVLKRQEAIASEITRGADPRKFDAESAQLHRQREDIEQIRHAIQNADLGGLSPQQEARGAKVIDQLRDHGMRVSNGEDLAKHRASFTQHVADLNDLRHWTGGSPAPAKPTPTPAPAPAPAPKPAPAPEPGGVYQVKNGDFLTKIARERLGDPNRFREIIALNQDKYPSLLKNPDLIHPGWTLVLPKK